MVQVQGSSTRFKGDVQERPAAWLRRLAQARFVAIAICSKNYLQNKRFEALHSSILRSEGGSMPSVASAFRCKACIHPHSLPSTSHQQRSDAHDAAQQPLYDAISSTMLHSNHSRMPPTQIGSHTTPCMPSMRHCPCSKRSPCRSGFF